MTLEMSRKAFEHPSGKQYQVAIIREVGSGWNDANVVVRNWGKYVTDDFSAGQIQFADWSNYSDGSLDYGKEINRRTSHGYVETRNEAWHPLRPAVLIGLESRGFDPSLGGRVTAHASPASPVTASYDAMGNVTYYDANGDQCDSGGNPLGVTKPAPKAKDPNEVPGPRTGGVKRLEWVMSHLDHPQAFDQMMQVAQQMAAEREKAATTVASIDNDLAFVNAWLHQQMAQQIIGQS